jgi:hypothetical protein
LVDCHKRIIEDLIGSSTKQIKAIFRKFQGTSSPINPSFNVLYSYGVCPNSSSQACTVGKVVDGFVNINIQKGRVSDITEFGFATVVLHELLHAYLIWQVGGSDDKDLNYLLNKYAEKYNSGNLIHHNLFVETYLLSVIAEGLKDYANLLNYNTTSLGDQYFVDLAWMGLHNTEIYKSKSQTDKIRIEQRINSEVFGKMGAISLKSCD